MVCTRRFIAFSSPGVAPRVGGIDFTPAVLAFRERPPSPVGRAIGGVIVGAVVAGATWACVGTVDIVAVAHGKLIVPDRSKLVQPLETGVVVAIHVRDGDAVRGGDLLVELDPTAAAADRDRLAREHSAVAVEIARLRALLEHRRAIAAPPAADAALVALHQRILEDQAAGDAARLDAAHALVEQRRAAIEATRASVERLEVTLPIHTERAAAFRALLASEYVSRMQYLEVEERRLDRTQELAAQRQRLAQDAAALVEAERQRDALASELVRARLADLAAAEMRAAALLQEHVKAARRAMAQRLTAPVDGVVQQLAVHTVGGVVTPAQPLMVIVPGEPEVEAEAWIENRDAGFVARGQAAVVKIDAFPFPRYGAIPGEVVAVSPEAVALEKVGLVYAARVSLARATMRIDADREVPLAPGMTVSVEVTTGRRRLIEFLLSPLLRALSEAARER